MTSSNVSYLPRRYKIFWWKYQKYPSVESYRAIWSCDLPAPRIWLWIWNDVKSNIILIFLSILYDDLINKILKTFFNFYSALIKGFLNHQSIRASRMRFPLTKSDRFHIDLLTISIHIPSYPNHPIYDWVMNKYEPKYGFIYTRFYDSLRLKNYMHNSHYKKTSLDR